MPSGRPQEKTPDLTRPEFAWLQVARWIAELDHDRFSVRRQATGALEKLGDEVKGDLLLKLVDKPSPEARQRIERLLERIEQRQLHPETVRGLRAVEVLEAVGSPQAREVLKRLASGHENALLTREAKTSLARLSKRLPAATPRVP